MNTMQQLISQADQNRQPGKRYSAAASDTAAGRIVCHRDFSIYKKGMPNHARTTWKLNGKTISAASLQAIISTL